MNFLDPKNSLTGVHENEPKAKARLCVISYAGLPQIQESETVEKIEKESDSHKEAPKISQSFSLLPNARKKREKGGSSIKINTEINEVQEIEANPEPSTPRGRRTARRSTVIDGNTLLNSLHANGNAADNRKAGKRDKSGTDLRRRSTRGASFMEISRRMSVANKFKKEARKAPKCIFEVGRHTVKELTEKVYEIAESSQSSKASDLDELNLLVGKLSDATFLERERFEEEYIRFHIAQKNLIDFPKNFQNEVDQMAMDIRAENVNLIMGLRNQRKAIEDDFKEFEIEGKLIEVSNNSLLDEKELSDDLISALVSGLNERMSLKAQTKIQVNKTMEENGKFIELTDGLPERLEMLTINIGGEIEEIKFSIIEGLLESENVEKESFSIADENVILKKEADLIAEEVKEKDRVIVKGNGVQEDRVRRICKESEAYTRLAFEKKILHQGFLMSRDRALEEQERTVKSDDEKISFWETKNLEINDQILKRLYELELAKSEMLKFDQKEKQLTAELKLAAAENLKLTTKCSLQTEQKNVLNKKFDDETGYGSKITINHKKSVEETKNTKNMLNDDLDRLQARQCTSNEARTTVVAAWTECDNTITDTKQNIVNYKMEQNIITNRLETELNEINEKKDNAKKELNNSRINLKNTSQKFKDDSEKFDKQEEQMENEFCSIIKALDSNIASVLQLRKTLKKREPIYIDHKNEAAENEKHYDNCKFKLVQVQNKEKEILLTISKTIKSTDVLQKKFEILLKSKNEIKEKTRESIKEDSAKVHNLDLERYELLVEREQYEVENNKINTFRTDINHHLIAMRKCYVRLSVQLVEYVTHYKELQSNLQQYRKVFDQFSNQSRADGNKILYSIINFEEEANRRHEILTKVQSDLLKMTEEFESYVSDAAKTRPKEPARKLTSNKRRFRVKMVPVDLGMKTHQNLLQSNITKS